jgi:hypothetical protein
VGDEGEGTYLYSTVRAISTVAVLQYSVPYSSDRVLVWIRIQVRNNTVLYFDDLTACRVSERLLGFPTFALASRTLLYGRGYQLMTVHPCFCQCQDIENRYSLYAALMT